MPILLFFDLPETDLLEIETALPDIKTALQEIETALPEIKTALLEIETALPESRFCRVENNYQPNEGLIVEV